MGVQCILLNEWRKRSNFKEIITEARSNYVITEFSVQRALKRAPKENAPAEVRKEVEDQHWKGFSVFLHVLLPIAGLALLWGQRGIFSKLLLQLDRSCVAVYCPSLSKREKLLKWASDRLPLTWSSQARTLSSGIPELWKDGSLLCTLINSVVPGACPNPHRHWRKPPLHAQALAYKYLGLAPMFTEDELSGEFTITQERNFIQYLHKLQEAINKWSTKDDENRKFSSQYVARGMGLYTGEQDRKTVFYLYANATVKKRSNVLMYIRGPYGTQGKATISPFHNLKTIPVVNVLQDQLEATKILPFKNEEQKSFLKTISLDFTSLVNNVEDNGKRNEIPIQIDMEIDRAKITYIPNNTGIYEINLICDGELLRGSPYTVQIINNTAGKKDTFDTEYENVEEKITFTKRKILSKVIDCIDEKICIDNGKVSKIKIKDSTESSTESESDDVTITAITKKKDEILKTEINCTLEDIIEEINLVQNEKNSVQTQTGVEKETKQHLDALDEIKKIAERLKTDVPQIINANKTIDETDNPITLKVDTKHKVVKDCDEAKTELVNLFQKEDFDEVDNKIHYNVETEQNIETPVKTLISKLDIGFAKSSKYFKNIVNSSSKQEMLGKTLSSDVSSEKEASDENNNSPKNIPTKRITSKIYFEISPKKTSKMSASFPELTSPICSEHIVPEVEKSSLNQLTLSEKRRTFSKQEGVNLPDSDVTFSSLENDDLSKSNENSTFRELSVLNVLDSLRQSRKNSLDESFSLSSTVSLPNMTSIDSNYESIDEGTFKARKDYWERLSSRSSSSVSLANSDCSFKKRKLANKNFVNKYNTIEKSYTRGKGRIIDGTKISTSDLSTTEVDGSEQMNKSPDTSLEDCSLIPLEERKKQLLKNMYQKGTSTPKKINIKNFFKKNTKSKKEDKESFFSPISDRIDNFDKNPKKKSKADNSSPEHIKQIVKSKQDDSPPKQTGEDCKDETKKTKHSIRSQFKKAIQFFKNLEKNHKLKEKNKTIITRRYSLDFQKKYSRKVRGGSLNLPNVSDRFSLSNLYEDVFGSKNGSFRGAPNKNGVASSLASLTKDVEVENPQTQEENGISYNLFVNKSKSKKRKSIKSLFDVNY